MGALFLNSLSVAPNKFVKAFENNCDLCLLRRKRSIMHCQGGGKTTRSSGVSSALKERSTVTDTAAGSLVLSPNGKGHAEIVVQDLVPFGGQATSLVELQDGIGIVKFLKAKNFFVTGATGFLAKVLIEKILRTVPDVGKIFIINAELFKCLKQTYGKSYQAFMLSKLVPAVGNVCENNLGLEEDLADVIAKEVDVIVNSAANTTFDERYDIAIDINTRGPCRLMEFAKQCNKLKLFVQVSTAYVNGQRRGKVMEKPFCMGDSIAKENFVSNSRRLIPTLDVENEMKLALESKEFSTDGEVAQKMKGLGLE
ncbi:hypothetical protein CISIN_1g0426941mg, partial [Citrus sinensis]